VCTDEDEAGIPRQLPHPTIKSPLLASPAMPVRFLKSESSPAFSATSCVSELSALCVKIRFLVFLFCSQLSTVDCRLVLTPTIPAHTTPRGGGIYRSLGPTTRMIQQKNERWHKRPALQEGMRREKGERRTDLKVGHDRGWTGESAVVCSGQPLGWFWVFPGGRPGDACGCALHPRDGLRSGE